MFKFLKEKLKESISKISDRIKKEAKEEAVEAAEEAEIKPAEEAPEPAQESAVEKEQKPLEEKKGFFQKLKEKFSGKKKEEQKLDEPPEIDLPAEEGPPRDIFAEIERKNDVKETEERLHIDDKEEYEKPAYVISAAEKREEIKEKIVIVKKEIEELKEMPSAGKKRHIAEEVEEIKHEVDEIEEKRKQKEEPKAYLEEEKSGFFSKIKQKIMTKKIDEAQFEEMFWDMEVALMENNVAVGVIEKIKSDLKNDLVDKPIKRNRVDETLLYSLKHSLNELLSIPSFDLLARIKQKKPFVICFFGINGSGKTTTIAKLAKLLKSKNISSVIAASDTFRAAAIDQLQVHADNLGIRLVKHDYGSDPAAVAFDAIKHAQSKNVDVVLIDTAGRMHSNVNLMEEMKKIIKVAKPDLKIFVGESITGNDCIEQAESFNNSIGIDAIILAKADIDEKGGAAVSVSYITKKPILYLGMGQGYDDLQRFDKNLVLQSLGLES